MNLSRLMPRFGKSADSDFTEEELDQQDADAKKAKLARTPKNGPRPVVWMTNGQYRRMVVRDKKAQQRKANSRYRRQWMRNQVAIAALRGQLSIVKSPTGHPAALVANAEKHLELVYGGVDEAQAHYDTVIASAA